MKPAASIRQSRAESGSDSYPNHRNYYSSSLAIFLSLAVLLAGAAAVVAIPAGIAVRSRKPDLRNAQLMVADLPLAFEQNRGQSAEDVRFLARGGGYTLFLTDHESVLSLRRPGSHRRDVLRTSLLGSNPDAPLEGQEPAPGQTFYFRGGPHSFQSQVPSFSRVRYRSVYPGIDLVYYGRDRQLEYDFVVSPNADPSAIRWEIEGAREIRITPQGDLDIALPGGVVRHRKPVIYQPAVDRDRPVEGAYRLLAANRVGFEVGAYDHSQPLVIDPVLLYATYLGGGDRDEANDVAVDPQGNIYVAGFTESANFPTAAGAVQRNYGGGDDDAFVTKLNPAGTARVFSTFLGGSSDDKANSIALDPGGNVAICGETNSADFPVSPGARQVTFGGGSEDAFVAKLASSGASLLFSTYLGGNAEDHCGAVAVDPSSNIYATGETESTGFPASSGTFQMNFGGGSGDAFITRFDPTGGVIYSSFLGGSGDDAGIAVTADATGRAYVAGYTQSGNFPVPPDAVQPARRGDRDAFLVIMTPPGRLQQTATYYGGSGLDEARAVALDPDGNIYLAGVTRSSNFPRPLTAIQNQFAGAADGFVVKFNPQGLGLLYTTLLGGAGEDTITGMAVDFAGNAIVGGVTTSRDFPPGAQPGPQQQYGGGGSDAFFAKIDPPGQALLQSSYLGGSGTDSSHGLAADTQGNVYLAGVAESGNFPVTPNAIQSSNDGPDAFVAKVGLDTLLTVSGASFDSSGVVAANSYATLAGHDVVSQLMVASTVPLPADLGGVSIKVTDSSGADRQAPMSATVPRAFGEFDQINFVIPAATANGLARLSVARNGVVVATGTAMIEPVAPGIFMALPADLAGLTNNPTNITAPPPAAVTIIVTREGVQQAPRLTFQTGRLGVFEPAPINLGLQTDQLILVLFGTGIRNAANVSARIGNSPVEVLFAGASPEFVAVDQVNMRIPFNFIGRGIVELHLIADGKAANVVSLWIQ